MIIDKTHKLFKDLILLDAFDAQVPNVVSWDIDMEMADVYLASNNIAIRTDRKTLVKARAYIPGAKLVYKDTLKPVSKEEL